jgi:hypothetical protein
MASNNTYLISNLFSAITIIYHKPSIKIKPSAKSMLNLSRYIDIWHSLMAFGTSDGIWHNPDIGTWHNLMAFGTI